MLCCLLCLTVCVVPALAGYNESGGFLYWSSDLDIVVTNSGNSYSVLNGYFPAAFSSGRDSSNATSLIVLGSAMPVGSSDIWNATTSSTFYVEVLYTVDAPLDITRTKWYDGCSVQGSLFFGNPNRASSAHSQRVYAADMAAVVDDDLIPLNSSSKADSFVVDAGTFHVKRYWGYRMYFNPLDLTWSSTMNQALKLANTDDYQYTFSDPNYSEGIYDNVVVNTGVLAEINGAVKDIQMTTSQIQNDVSDIKNGLQDSNSGIWQSFKDSVSGLFVPSSGDLEGVKNGFDQLAQEKLGGAYQTVELVDNGVQSVVDKFKNPGSNPGVEFPGISVPLGGDVGTVALAASQTVTIPEKIQNVLYPVAGVIIPIVCVIWTIRQCTDMVECFMSGMSYAEFLHRNSDKEDDEV